MCGCALDFGVEENRTCVTSGIRVALIPAMTASDPTWKGVLPGIMISVEANLVIVTGSLPAMRLFLTHVCPGLFEGSSSTRAKTSGHGSEHISELQTISSKRLRNQYGNLSGYGDDADVSDDGRALAWVHDGNSEKAIVPPTIGIMKTETIDIQYRE